LPLTAETDCSKAMELMKRTIPNTFVYAFRITVISELLRERDIGFIKVSREANMAKHELAKVGQVKRSHRLNIDLRYG
jgi:predicted transcriptional regulator